MMILQTIKKMLKTQKISYQDLALQIGMSESGVKKLLTAKDISVTRLSQIAEILGVGLADLMKMSEDQNIKSVRLTKKQEESLFENSSLFRVFWLLAIEEKNQNEIKRIEKLNAQQLERLFLKLETLDLLRRSPKGQILSVHKGLYRWVGDNPFLNKLNREWSENTLRKVLKDRESSTKYHRLSYMKMTPSLREEFFQKLTELVDDYARKAQRARLDSRDLTSISFLLAIDSSGFLE